MALREEEKTSCRREARGPGVRGIGAVGRGGDASRSAGAEAGALEVVVEGSWEFATGSGLEEGSGGGCCWGASVAIL